MIILECLVLLMSIYIFQYIITTNYYSHSDENSDLDYGIGAKFFQ